jgi:hypothetical protein
MGKLGGMLSSSMKKDSIEQDFEIFVSSHHKNVLLVSIGLLRIKHKKVTRTHWSKTDPLRLAG